MNSIKVRFLTTQKDFGFIMKSPNEDEVNDFVDDLYPIFGNIEDDGTPTINEKDYWECIKQYNNSKDLGWHDAEFELMAGTSYGMVWKKSKDKSHLKQAKKLMKLAKKHGHPNAKELLKKLKEAEKKKN